MYTQVQHQFLFASGMTATASGDKAVWLPGYQPHIIRAVGAVFTTSGMTASGLVLAFKTQSLASGAAAAADLAVLAGPWGTAVLGPGQVMYKDGLNTKVSPGQKVIFNVRTAVAGTCGIRAFIWVEPSPEIPANVTLPGTTTPNMSNL